MKVIKAGRSAEAAAEDIAQVRATVESTLAEIAQRGDRAVRELSINSTNGIARTTACRTRKSKTASVS